MCLNQLYRSVAGRVIAIFLCFSTAISAAAVPELNSLRRPGDGSEQLPKHSVYVYGDGLLDRLSPVRILGAVSKAGVHYIPANTDLVTLISLAGGTLPEADLESIIIKRQKNGVGEVIEVDLKRLVEEPEAKSIVLHADDTILISRETFTISDGALRTLGVITGISSVILTAVLISRGG